MAFNVIEEGEQAASNVSWWNFRKPEDQDFSIKIRGTITKIVEVQKTEMKNGQWVPAWWKDKEGIKHPKFEYRFYIHSNKTDAVRIWQVGLRYTTAAAAINEALVKAGFKRGTTENLEGADIEIETVEPPKGFRYGPGNPRPWSIIIHGKGPHPYEGTFPWTGDDDAKVSDNNDDAPVATMTNYKQPQWEEVPELYEDEIPF